MMGAEISMGYFKDLGREAGRWLVGDVPDCSGTLGLSSGFAHCWLMPGPLQVWPSTSLKTAPTYGQARRDRVIVS